MFFNKINTNLKVLEGQLNYFEEMSKEMMKTLTIAVEKITEANQNVAKCLVSHEEKLIQVADNYKITLEKIEALREEKLKDQIVIISKIESIEKKIDQNTVEINAKLSENDLFRGRLIGIGLVLTFIVGIGAVIVPLVGSGLNLYIDSRQEQIELYQKRIESENLK